MQNNNNTRGDAIKWWRLQSDEYKQMQFNQYEKEHFTPANDFTMLTGREIENIFLDIRLSERAIKEQGTEDSPDLLDGITPGEWRINQSFHIWGDDCKIAALDNNIQSSIYRKKSAQEMEANAKLLLAAPKLAAENKELKTQLKKCRNALAASLESNTQTLEMNKREVTALKERIEVLTKALERLNKVAEMYLTNTEKHPDFKMTAESTITQYFKETVAKAKEALNRKA